MAKAQATKSPVDSARNSYVHSLAFRWLEKQRPDVFQAIKEAGDEQYPRSGKGRKRIELTDDLAKMK